MWRGDGAKELTSKALTGLLLALSLVALTALPFASAAHAATRLLVQKRFSQAAPAIAVSASFKKANTAHNLIVAYVVWDNGDAVTITDSNGNTYASAIGPT